VESLVLVKVHSIPGYNVDWEHACLCSNLPCDVIYIQPHGFCESNYCPVWLLAIDDEDDVSTVHITMRGSTSEDEFTGRILLLAPATRLPPAYVYCCSISSNAMSPSSWVEEFLVWSCELPCHGSAVPGEGDDESARVAEPSLQETLNDVLNMASGNTWPAVEMAYH
jgi:hypothetical protein